MTTEVLHEESEETLTRRRATVEEFWSLPETVLPAEYVNGEIVMAPAPMPGHQIAIRSIFRALDRFVLGASLGEVYFSPFDVILPSGDVVQPDIFFLTTEEAKRVSPGRRLRVVPSLVVEVLSPGTAAYDTLTKREIYEKNGVREYWIVDAERQRVAQLVMRKKRYAVKELGADDVLKSPVLEGFESRVGELLGSE